MNYWLIAIGGALGSLGRFLLGSAIARSAPGFPVHTLVINVLGSLVIGIVLRYTAALPGSGEALRAFLAVGVCGGFTTFSTFSAETAGLLESGAWTRAALYAALSLGLCLAATFAGFAIGRQLVPAR